MMKYFLGICTPSLSISSLWRSRRCLRLYVARPTRSAYPKKIFHHVMPSIPRAGLLAFQHPGRKPDRIEAPFFEQPYFQDDDTNVQYMYGITPYLGNLLQRLQGLDSSSCAVVRARRLRKRQILLTCRLESSSASDDDTNVQYMYGITPYLGNLLQRTCQVAEYLAFYQDVEMPTTLLEECSALHWTLVSSS
jgi:hypothetical protein